MGFRKAIYDVEEKGLDPQKPHRALGDDGRLVPVVPDKHTNEANLDTPAADTEIVTQDLVENNKLEEIAANATDEMTLAPDVEVEELTTTETNQENDNKEQDKPKVALKELPEKQKDTAVIEKAKAEKKPVTKSQGSTNRKPKTTRKPAKKTSSKAPGKKPVKNTKSNKRGKGKKKEE